MHRAFAFVFPGQGSQHLGMLNELATKYPLIKDRFSMASDALGYDLWNLAQEGPVDKLNQTEITQPALLVAGVAIWHVWNQKGAPSPQFLAGHSLGEYTALVCADALDFISAVRLVELRGKYMQSAVPSGQGSMAAIIGLNDDVIQEICETASDNPEVVSPANFNSVGQIVIAGNVYAVDRAISLAKEKGAKLAKKLPVSVPSHCQLMQPAAEQLSEKLHEITFKCPEIPVIHNVDICAYSDAKQIKDALIRQLYSPVRWLETVQYFVNRKVLTIIESGPGKVLTGLNKRIDENIVGVSITHPDSFQEAFNYLGE